MRLLDQYDLFRKDRDSRQGGGVLIATKKELQAEHQTNLDTNCEALWAALSYRQQEHFISAASIGLTVKTKLVAVPSGMHWIVFPATAT